MTHAGRRRHQVLDGVRAGRERDHPVLVGGQVQLAGREGAVVVHGYPQVGVTRCPLVRRLAPGAVLEPPEAVDQLHPAEGVAAVEAGAAEPDAERAAVAAAPHRGRRRDVEADEVAPEEDLGAGRAHAGIGLQGVDEGRQPPGVDGGVVVDQGHVVDAGQVAEPQVAAAGEAPVAARLDDAHPGHAGLDPGRHPVDRGVVDEDDLQVLGRPVGGEHAVEAGQGVVAAVVVDDHDPDPGPGPGRRGVASAGSVKGRRSRSAPAAVACGWPC